MISMHKQNPSVIRFFWDLATVNEHFDEIIQESTSEYIPIAFVARIIHPKTKNKINI